MSEVLGKKVLILNSDYRPISYYPLSLNSMKRVLKSLLKNKLTIIEEYDDEIVVGGSTMKLPKTAILKKYIKIDQTPKFNRYNVYLRDKFTCQFCGKRFHYDDLTFDHIVPRCKGGKTSWLNITTACKTCNGNKGYKDVDGKRIVLLSKPHIPSNRELLHNLKELQLDVNTQIENWNQWISNI
jgi:5-methylcytosine-specific restriction endonuclease McrA